MFAVLALCPAGALAAGRIGLLDVEGIGVGDEILEWTTDEIRAGLEGALEGGDWIVVSEQESCQDGPCESIDYLVTSLLTGNQGGLDLRVELVRTSDYATLAEQTIRAADQDELLGAVRSAANRLPIDGRLLEGRSTFLEPSTVVLSLDNFDLRNTSLVLMGESKGDPWRLALGVGVGIPSIDTRQPGFDGFAFNADLFVGVIRRIVGPLDLMATTAIGFVSIDCKVSQGCSGAGEAQEDGSYAYGFGRWSNALLLQLRMGPAKFRAGYGYQLPFGDKHLGIGPSWGPYFSLGCDFAGVERLMGEP
ncbi:hypothetical protein [Vulgatibacter incomptus]|uniref:Uncharacterized protein n=1 Tax=Vulgatibacter incomptus TaxID=1391653 RepID=A0A0K1PGA2_9BACT|nr:hypothetical protein [Vulgatibacter incomptus]AKU92563.1 hypothetical protein AKJ08_2950 [Vulgatibacter incomptus]